MHVVPKQDLKVRDPERGGHLPPEVRRVPDTPYWRRRLRDGDVVAVESGKPKEIKS